MTGTGPDTKKGKDKCCNFVDFLRNHVFNPAVNYERLEL